MTTGAAEGQSRLGGRGLGAGRARSPALPSRLGARPGRARLRYHGSHQLEFWPPARTPVSHPSVPAKDARPWVTSWPGCGQCVWPTCTAFLKTQAERTGQGTTDGSPGIEPGRGFAQAAPAWGCCGAAAHQGHRSHGNPVHPARTRMEHDWPATVNPARLSIPTTKIRSCSLSGAAGRAQVAVGTSGSFTLGNAQQPVWRLRGQVQACGDDSPTSRWPWLSKGTPSWSFQTSAISCPFMLSTKTSFELYNYFKNTFKISPYVGNRGPSSPFI